MSRSFKMQYKGVNMLVRRIASLCLIAVLITTLLGNASAVAPTPEAIEKWKAEGTYEQNVAIWKQFKAQGGCAPSEHSLFNKKKISDKMAAGIQAIDTASILVILVDFSDQTWNGLMNGQVVAAQPYQFDSILFSDRDVDAVFNPTGSMTDFYKENSYRTFYIIGGIKGWHRMPLLYTDYVGSNHGLGAGGQLLARDAVLAADADTSVHFQDYDHNHDGVIDGLVIIHAGQGAEGGGTGIWSHKYHLSSHFVRDGVDMYDYTLNPEEGFGGISPIGVICHEFGHFLGLPDLYDIADTTNTSHGLGRWSIMATGNYNGNARRPAHFDAWCKSQTGFLNLVNVTANLDSVAFPAVEFTPLAYRLINSTSNPEYWLVENRQKIGFDLNLPSSGILIYHIDPNAPTINGSNVDPNRYRVGLVQADGNFDLNYTLGNDGDAGDPFPGTSNNRAFHDLTNPGDTVNYSSDAANIGVWEISDNDSVMFADLDNSWSRPYIVEDSILLDDALGNGDGNLDPGETIQAFFIARNLERVGYSARASLATSNPYVNITANNVLFANTFNALPADNDLAPIIFTVDDSAKTKLDSFYLTISCDSLNGVPGHGLNYSKTFGFEAAVGTPRILIVDDDRGDTLELGVKDVFRRSRVATNIWHKKVQGTPTSIELLKYPTVFWTTGDSAANVISAADIAVMKTYLNAGKNLFLSTMSGIKDMHVLDSAFLNNYFKATYAGQTSSSDARGVSGSTLGNNTRYRPAYVAPFDHQRQIMTPTPGGESFLSHTLGSPLPSCGISYSGSYKSVLLSFAFESIRDDVTGAFKPKDTLLNRILNFFGDVSVGINEGDPLEQLPQTFALNQNFPNPFNPSTTISYTIHSRGSIGREPNRTLLEIYNILGQRVRTLVDLPQSPGAYTVQWGGETDSGTKVSSGIYFYRLVLGGESQTKKMVLMK